MTDGIDPARLRRDTDYLHSDPPPARKAVAQCAVRPEDLPDASFGPLPRIRADVSVQRAGEPKPPVQARLDAFLESATPKYVVDGHEVRVPIPFRMTVDVSKLKATDRWRINEESTVAPNKQDLEAAAASVGLGDERHVGLLRSGRATPQDVQKVTQALIDRDRLPRQSKELPDATSRVRKMMVDYGLGMDCAGYTQQAFLASRGERRAQTRLNPEIANEDLTHLEHEGFRRVPIDAARPGDILVLDPPPEPKDQPGHTLIVYERREATTDELRELRRLPEFRTGHVTAYVLDSSYGSEGTFNHGGVMRQIWWRNDDTKDWARRNPDEPNLFQQWSGKDERHPALPEQDRPYFGHTIHGVYRPVTEAP